MSARPPKQPQARLANLATLAILGILLLLAGFLGLDYFQQQSEQAGAREQLTRLRAIVASGALERIEQVKAEYQKTQEAIPSAGFDQLNVFEAIGSMAQERGVGLTWTPYKDTPEKVEGTEYRVLSFSLTATGSYEAVWGFVQDLDTGKTTLGTLVVKEVRLSLGEETTATVDFAVYSRPKAS